MLHKRCHFSPFLFILIKFLYFYKPHTAYLSQARPGEINKNKNVKIVEPHYFYQKIKCIQISF